MKLFTTLMVPCILSLQSFGQDQVPENKSFAVVESASFPGGINKFHQYILDNLVYPKDAKKKKVRGNAYVEFIINLDGYVDKDSIRVIPTDELRRTLPPRLDGTMPEIIDLTESCITEAIRVVKNSPKWIPGKTKNVPSRQKFVIPIYFGRSQ